jgi:hypothetical protein
MHLPANTSDPKGWASAFATAAGTPRKALAKADVELTGAQEANLAELEAAAENIIQDDEKHAKAREWVAKKLPTIVYVDEYTISRDTRTSGSTCHEKRRVYLQTWIPTSKNVPSG